MLINAPYLTYDKIRHRADFFLNEHNPNGSIPVPIEDIIDVGLRMDIVPIPGLRNFDIVAYITQDLNEIRVDEHIYHYRINRYRFSLAHEIAHKVLHSDIYSQLKSSSVEEWKETIRNAISDREYGFLEYQANCFAGLILVPSDELEKQFQEGITLAREHGIDLRDPDTGGREYIEEFLARYFEVSSVVVNKRLAFDSLWASL